MFNGYNETPFSSSNEFDVGKEKKPENVSKWWYGSNSQHIRYQPPNRMSEFWTAQPNFVGMQKCNCSDCYSSVDNQSYQNNTSRHRPWLPKTFSVPSNNPNEFCKLPAYQWESSLPSKNVYDFKANIPNFNANENGGKYPYHRVTEPNQSGVITSSRNPDSAKKPKDEISNEMGFYDFYKSKQQMFCNPAWNLSKTINNSDLYDVGEKYQNTDPYKYSATSHSAELHTSKPPVIEPYTNVVPFLQNRVPLTGQQSFKGDLGHSTLETSFNDTQKTHEESNEFSENKHLKLYHCQMGKEINNVYPMHNMQGVDHGLKNTGMIQHNPYNLPCRNSYNTENQKLSIENIQADEFYSRKNSATMLTRSSCDLDSGKQWQINQLPENFSDGPSNNFRGYCGVFFPELCKDNKSLRAKKFEKGNSLGLRLNENNIRNENFRMHASNYNDSRPQSYFPCQNNSTTNRNYVRSDYPPQGYNVPSRHEYHPVTHEKFQYQYAPKNSQQPLQNYNASQIIYHGSNAPTFNTILQQPEGKNNQPQTKFFSYKDKQNSASEDFRSSDDTKTDFLQTISNEDINKGRNNKISPLRLLRKKKNLNQNDVEPVPVSKNLSGVQNLDVRKFFSTWVEEEEESETPTQVLVLDCQNLDPEQTKFLYLYDNDGIVTLKSADSVKESEKQELDQELREKIFLTVEQDATESINAEETKKPCETFEQFEVSEPQLQLNYQEIAKSTSNIQEPKNSHAEAESLKLAKSSKLSEKTDTVCSKKIETRKTSDEMGHLDKWTEKKFDFLKRSEESKAAEISRKKEEQKKIFEKRNSLQQIYENKATFNSSQNKVPEKLSESLQSPNTSIHVNSPSCSESPTLPTSEYRRNKFLNYTDQKVITSPKRSLEVDGSLTINKDEKVPENENLCQHTENVESSINSSLPSDKIDFKPKLLNLDAIIEGENKEKMPEISFENTDVKVENENFENKIKLSHNKKLKKSKKNNCECESEDKNDKVTVDQIKFSIQKSHDLKISFKVLNSAANKYENSEEKVEESTNQMNSNETSNSTELITLKLKSIQNGDLSESKRGFRRKKFKKDSKKAPVVKIKKSTYFEEKDPLAIDADYDNSLSVPEDSSFQGHENDFQVKETVDSAKIKLTFKRHKSSFETECKVNQGIDDLEASDLENRPRKKWKKMKRREKGPEFVKADFSNTERVSSKIYAEVDSKTVKFESEEDTQNYKILASEEKNDLCFTDSLVHPLSPVKECVTSSVDVPLWEEKSVENFSHDILEKFEENLESTDDDFCVKFVDEIQETDFNDKNKSESLGESSKNDYSSDISNNQGFEKTKNQIPETLSDFNNDESVCDENSVEKTRKDFLNLFAEERERDANFTKSELIEEKLTIETNEGGEEKTILSKTQIPVNLEENLGKNYLGLKLYAREIKNKSQSEEKFSSDEVLNLKNFKSVEKNLEDSEFVVEKLEKEEEGKFSKEVGIAENEVLINKTVNEFSNIEGIVEEIGNSEIFQSCSTLNSNEKGSCCDIESPESELSFTLQTCTLDNDELKNDCEKISEVENNEINCDSVEEINEITHVDFLEKSYENKEQENSSKSLNSSDYCPERKKIMLSCENLKENQPLEISGSFVSSFLTLNTVEEVNVCEADCSANDELIFSSSNSPDKVMAESSVEEVSDKSLSLSLSLDKTNEYNTNNLKLNNECQYSEANKAIYKASPTCQPFSHIKTEELGEKEIIGDGFNELHSFETGIKKTENIALTSPQKDFLEKLCFDKQDNSHEVEIIGKKGVRRKPDFTNNIIIKRRNSFTTKSEDCEDLDFFKVSRSRQRSCPPCLKFLNIPHLDIPVEKIPLPPGNPLPENIFDFKRYFLLKEKESINGSRKSEETKRLGTAIQEKPNHQKCLENWKNEKDIKIKSQSSTNAGKEIKYTPRDNTKIKFSFPKLKSLKSIFSENEIDNLCSLQQKKLINSFREQKTIVLENSKSQSGSNEKFVKNESIDYNASLKLNSTEVSTQEEINFENQNINGENCQNKLVYEHELQKNLLSTVNDYNKDLSPKVPNDLELEIVEEIDQEQTLVKDFVVDNFIENEFYKCEDIPTSEDLTNGEGEIEDQKVSDDDKFRNIMQNCLDNAKRFLSEGNLKLLSCSVENLLEFDCGETNIDENEISETSINHISRDVLLTSCIGNDMTFPEKFQPTDVTDDYVSFFASEGPHNLCSEILPVDNWPYLEEEVPSSPVTKNSEETDLILTFEDIGNQNSFDEENITSAKEKPLLPDTKHLKNLRRKSIVAEVDSLDNTSKPKKERRKTIDCFTENFWSYQKHSTKVIQEIKNEFENFWQKNISLKYHTNFKHNTKKIEKMNKEKEKETINYKSSKWQPKVILFRISKAGLERKIEKFKLNNPTCDQIKRKKFSEEINFKPVLEKQKSINSIQSPSALKKKESKDSCMHLKVSSGKKPQNNQIQENNSKYSAKNSEIKKSKKSRFRNLHSKEKKESKLLHDAKDIGTYHKLLPETSILVDADKSFSEPSFKPKKDVLNSEAKLTNSKEKRKKSEGKHFSEKKENFFCNKNGSAKVEEKTLKKSEDSEKQYYNHHHHSKKSKHRREHRERKDSSRSDHKRRDKSPEKVKKQSKVKSSEAEDSGHEPVPVEPWVCQVCGFRDANERISHIKSHPFHCQSCHLAFKTEAFFVNHLTEKHKDIRNQHHCLLCELSFDTEKEYLQHLETREHRHLESVEKNTINTLLTLLTGQPCPVLGVADMKPEWLPNQAGTVHFYHQATPLSLALQYLKMHHNLPLYSNVPSPSST